MTEVIANAEPTAGQPAVAESEPSAVPEPTLYCSEYGTAEPGMRVEFYARAPDGNVVLKNVRWETIASETGIPRADVRRLLPQVVGEARGGKRWSIVEQDERGCLMVCHAVGATVSAEAALAFAGLVTAAAQKKPPPGQAVPESDHNK